VTKVTSVYYSLEHDWILSTSRDKYFSWHSVDSSRRIGAYSTSSWCTTLAYDTQSKHCFVGDNSGNISFIKLTDNGSQFIANLSGHENTITNLVWDPTRKYLYSSSTDKKIIIWDIGGQKGLTYDLEGHLDRVYGLVYSSLTRQLVSAGLDSKLVVWDMIAKRQENPEWSTSDDCEFCKRPFFWNIKSMWEQKKVGLRQHHCRRCGVAVCDPCSSARSKLPTLGHEYDVRVCSKCIGEITPEERVPLATFHETKQCITGMSYDESRKILITVGSDRTIKIWDMSEILSL
jgi:WD40 repeat protein